jgi:hypothetical protein
MKTFAFLVLAVTTRAALASDEEEVYFSNRSAEPIDLASWSERIVRDAEGDPSCPPEAQVAYHNYTKDPVSFLGKVMELPRCSSELYEEWGEKDPEPFDNFTGCEGSRYRVIASAPGKCSECGWTKIIQNSVTHNDYLAVIYKRSWNEQIAKFWEQWTANVLDMKRRMEKNYENAMMIVLTNAAGELGNIQKLEEACLKNWRINVTKITAKDYVPSCLPKPWANYGPKTWACVILAAIIVLIVALMAFSCYRHRQQRALARREELLTVAPSPT